MDDHGIVLPGLGPEIGPLEGFVIEDEEVIDDIEEEDKEGGKAEDKAKAVALLRKSNLPRSSREPRGCADHDLGGNGAAEHQSSFIRDG